MVDPEIDGLLGKQLIGQFKAYRHAGLWWRGGT